MTYVRCTTCNEDFALDYGMAVRVVSGTGVKSYEFICRTCGTVYTEELTQKKQSTVAQVIKANQDLRESFTRQY